MDSSWRKLKHVMDKLCLLILYSLFRAFELYLNKNQQDATVCGYLFTAKSLSTCFGCPSHPSSGLHKIVTAASGTGHITYLCNNLPPRWPNQDTVLIWPRWRKAVAQIVWLVPEAAVTGLYSLDDVCDGHPKHVESNFAVNKYLHTVASCWILLIHMSAKLMN